MGTPIDLGTGCFKLLKENTELTPEEIEEEKKEDGPKLKIPVLENYGV